MKKLVILGFSALSVLGLAACGDEKKSDTDVSQEVDVESKEVTSIGFVTYIKDNEYVEIEVEGVTLQFETNTEGISIGNRVSVTYQGKLEDQKISEIAIDKSLSNSQTPDVQEGDKNTDKKVIYIDKYGNVIEDLEEFRENIKNNNLNSKEEETKEEEKEDAPVTEDAGAGSTVPGGTTNGDTVNGGATNGGTVTGGTVTEEVDKNKPQVTTTKVVFYGKADSHSVEVKSNGEFKVFYLEDDSISAKFDSMTLEKEITVETYKDASGRTIIKSIK